MSRLERRHQRERRIRRFTLLILSLPFLLVGLFWLALPTLLAPVESFDQGPGAAIAYASLVQQLRAQEPTLQRGGELSLRFTEDEWNGLVASAVLSGRGESFPVKRIRTQLLTDGVRLDAVVEPLPDRVPDRFERPIGIQAALHLESLGAREAIFSLSQIRLGWLPVPNTMLTTLSGRLGNPIPGLDPQSARLTVPLAQLIEGQVQRAVQLKTLKIKPGQITLTVLVGPKR
jgi:hypothetical protein